MYFKLNNLRIAYISFLALLLAVGCSKAIDQNINLNAVKAASDFGKSEIISSTGAPADGQSNAFVLLKIVNFDGSVVKNFTPKFNITPTFGMKSGSCTPTDINGFSTCSIQAVVPGVKNFFLTNARNILTTQFSFTIPSNTQNISANSGVIVNGSTVDGYKVSMSLGSPVHGFNTITRDGYHLHFFLKGNEKK